MPSTITYGFNSLSIINTDSVFKSFQSRSYVSSWHHKRFPPAQSRRHSPSIRQGNSALSPAGLLPRTTCSISAPPPAPETRICALAGIPHPRFLFRREAPPPSGTGLWQQCTRTWLHTAMPVRHYSRIRLGKPCLTDGVFSRFSVIISFENIDFLCIFRIFVANL